MAAIRPVKSNIPFSRPKPPVTSGGDATRRRRRHCGIRADAAAVVTSRPNALDPVAHRARCGELARPSALSARVRAGQPMPGIVDHDGGNDLHLRAWDRSDVPHAPLRPREVGPRRVQVPPHDRPGGHRRRASAGSARAAPVHPVFCAAERRRHMGSVAQSRSHRSARPTRSSAAPRLSPSPRQPGPLAGSGWIHPISEAARSRTISSATRWVPGSGRADFDSI